MIAVASRAQAPSYASVNWQNPIKKHPLNDDLLGWWLVHPYWSGGFVLRDLTGRSHGTLTSMDPATAWITRSPRGGWGSLDFVGGDSNEFVNCGDSAYLSLNRDFSVFARCRPEVSATLLAIVSHGDNEWYLRINTDNVLQVVDSQLADIVAGTRTVTVNEWHHCGFTVSPEATGTVSLYLDGVFDASTTTARSFSDGVEPVMIGADNRLDARTEEFNGQISEVRIDGREFSASEVDRLYQESLHGYSNLLRRWASGAAIVPAAAGGVWDLASNKQGTTSSRAIHELGPIPAS